MRWRKNRSRNSKHIYISIVLACLLATGAMTLNVYADESAEGDSGYRGDIGGRY